MLADLLSECFAADLEESWERERTATPVRASPSGSTRPVVLSEKYKRFFVFSALNALIR